jgi:hypothetical protein
MYRRIPWELVADPLGSSEHTLGTTSIPTAVFIERNVNKNWVGFGGYS